MSERSLRLKRDTPLEMVIAAFNGLAERVDAIEGKGSPDGEDERVMIRAVSPGHPGPDDDSDTWVLNPNATGHRAQFAVGDLVVEASGYRGIHQVVAVSVDPDAPTHRRLRLTVRRTDVVVDADEF